jgi:hypothetical protein
VGIEIVEGLEPRQEALAARGEMRVGDVQQPQRLRVRRQYGHLEATQGKPVPLDHRRVADRGGAEGGGDRDKSSQSHRLMVP